MRKDFKIRTVVAVLAMALLTQAAYAQGSKTKGKGQSPQESSESKEDAAKKKTLDVDYKNALKNIPAATEKPDPWKSMR